MAATKVRRAKAREPFCSGRRRGGWRRRGQPLQSCQQYRRASVPARSSHDCSAGACELRVQRDTEIMSLLPRRRVARSDARGRRDRHKAGCRLGPNARLGANRKLGRISENRNSGSALVVGRDLLDQIDDPAAELRVLDAHEGLGQREPVRGRQEVGDIGRRRRLRQSRPAFVPERAARLRRRTTPALAGCARSVEAGSRRSGSHPSRTSALAGR